MKDRIVIEIERFTGIEEMTPEVVYLPFETAYRHPYRKFHENAWSAAIDGEIVLVDENLDNLWENLGEIVADQLSSRETENGNGWLTSGDYPENGEDTGNGSAADEQDQPSEEGDDDGP